MLSVLVMHTCLLVIADSDADLAIQLEKEVIRQRQAIKKLHAKIESMTTEHSSSPSTHKHTITVYVDGDKIRQEDESTQGNVHCIRIINGKEYYFWPNKNKVQGKSLVPTLDEFSNNVDQYKIADPRNLGLSTLDYLNMVYHGTSSLLGNPDKVATSFKVTDNTLTTTYYQASSKSTEEVTYNKTNLRVERIVEKFTNANAEYVVEMRVLEWYVQGEISFPKHLEIHRTKAGKPLESYDIKVSHLSINTEISDQFSVKSLGMEKGTPVSDSRTGNSGMKLWDGEKLIDTLGKQDNKASHALSSTSWYIIVAIVSGAIFLALVSFVSRRPRNLAVGQS